MQVTPGGSRSPKQLDHAEVVGGTGYSNYQNGEMWVAVQAVV
jgi:hypothetical protein